MAMDDSLGKEALVTVTSSTVHISAVHGDNVNFTFSLFIFRQERKGDEVDYYSKLYLLQLSLMRHLFGYK